MTISQDLIERVRGLTGPDREVDALILCALPPFGRNWTPDGCWAGRASFSYADGSKDSRTAPVYTASIDAALALAERVLGDHWFGVLVDATREFGAAGTLGPDHLARYIVLATLTAIQSSETSNA